jgi:hypothetical protein
MDTLYNNTKLPKDVCKIIINYIDYTSDKLEKLVEINYKNFNELTSTFNNNIKLSLFDLLLKANKLGYTGFWDNSKNNSTQNFFDTSKIDSLIDVKIYGDNIFTILKSAKTGTAINIYALLYI